MARRSAGPPRHFWGARESVAFTDLVAGSSLGRRLGAFLGRSVLLATRDQLTAALAMIELDGVARRMIICPPDVSADHLPEVIGRAGVEAIVSDHDRYDTGSPGVPLNIPISSVITPAEHVELDHHATEWVLLTSGTTGRPKMLAHTLATYSRKRARSLMRRPCASCVVMPVPCAIGGSPSFSA